MKFYSFFKNIAFNIDPETAHTVSIKLLGKCPSFFSDIFGGDPFHDKRLAVNLKCGLKWSAPIGLAAGLDKNGEAIDFFSELPFGAIEIGTVTPLAQSGNPKPRMFRLVEDKSLLNRMGFNNQGGDSVHKNIKRSFPRKKCLGINLGKNKDTSEQNAPLDYQKLYKKFSNLSDYLVVNVSSPNTPGLRDLQREAGLKDIFENLKEARHSNNKPLFLKIAPDLSFDDLEPILNIAENYKLAGIIATNTTIIPEKGVGGVSGDLLKKRSFAMRKELLSRIGRDSTLDIIGVGGISTFDELWDFWKMGGRAVQIYTSFIYQGPQVLHDIYTEVLRVMKYNEVSSLSELLENIDSMKRPL